MTTFGERFREARHRQKHTQEGAAMLLGVSVSTVRAWERNSPPPTVPRVKMIRRAAEQYINTTS